MLAALEELSILIREEVKKLKGAEERGVEVCDGADGTPTTRIDRLAEQVVLDFVEERDLPVNILSEEIGHVDRGQERTLVVDPIDGTYNSIMGVPMYTVSLAVGTRSLMDVEIAYIRNLVTDEVYHAVRGHGAFHDGHRMAAKQASDPLRLIMIMYMGRSAHPDTFSLVKKVLRTRSYGCASLEMCLVADGMVDGFYMNSEDYCKSIRVVDIAASHLILREAGGSIVTMDGKEMDMPFDLDVRSNFLAMGDHRLKEAIL
jgi:fructose-1,6-bisphosphatase/inositol monophosphatase family enzyme